ncbi:hypothetical protein KY290_017899 [Solanum tuberosum]|uniref:Uncharacterized protein n=1 Tax=Solanum tuberosum TaxID=4113 RepID=A0ABQ7VEF2_SOLTU|nr:hypothetical protein KY285_016862 [Solanum tuberosum]KAH0761826.1 hypothetical protein KY290_017899 [Solanum tuberosum]
MEYNILAVVEELVVVQSVASLRRDTQPTLLEQKCRSPEQIPHGVQPMYDKTLETMKVNNEEADDEETLLVWSRKRVRGANVSPVDIPDLGATEVVPETRIENKPTESERKQKKEREGENGGISNQRRKKEICNKRGGTKITWRCSGGKQGIYREKSKTKKAFRVPTEEPTSVPQNIGSSETKSEDIVRAVVKRKKQAEKEQVKAKGVPNSVKKSPVKEDKVTKRDPLKQKSIKGLGPTNQKC